MNHPKPSHIHRNLLNPFEHFTSCLSSCHSSYTAAVPSPQKPHFLPLGYCRKAPHQLVLPHFKKTTTCFIDSPPGQVEVVRGEAWSRRRLDECLFFGVLLPLRFSSSSRVGRRGSCVTRPYETVGMRFTKLGSCVGERVRRPLCLCCSSLPEDAVCRTVLCLRGEDEGEGVVRRHRMTGRMWFDKLFERALVWAGV